MKSLLYHSCRECNKQIFHWLQNTRQLYNTLLAYFTIIFCMLYYVCLSEANIKALQASSYRLIHLKNFNKTSLKYIRNIIRTKYLIIKVFMIKSKLSAYLNVLMLCIVVFSLQIAPAIASNPCFGTKQLFRQVFGYWSITSIYHELML